MDVPHANNVNQQRDGSRLRHVRSARCVRSAHWPPMPIPGPSSCRA